MALHTELEIHKVAEELFQLSLNLVRHIPRDLKQVAGNKIRDVSLEILLLIGRANMAHDKRQHLTQVIESTWALNYLFRALSDSGAISRGQHAKVMKLTASVGRQANAWKKKSATAPAA
ncbi:four helix bundle protein [Pseudomonas guariconensis]|uniref:four helix bundle protein n=1 Tax=Pseudomonas guariconensis TaxID=1288410 RepID=UPI003905924C